MQYVTDRLDLRRDIRFSTAITSAHYDEDRGRWTIRTDRGDVVDAQFFVSCAGMLSAPMENSLRRPGRLHRRDPPHLPVAGRGGLAGKRVGVVGIGATGIQVIQTIADEVGHLTVFARTPQYVLPMKSPSYGPAEQAEYKVRFAELRSTLPNTFTGFEYDFVHVWAECSPEQRRAVLEEIYEDGSLKLWLASFGEMFFLQDVSDEISEFVREKMRARLKDQRLIDILVPTDYGFGTHRVPLERNYLEVYHRRTSSWSASATTRSRGSPRGDRARRRHRPRAGRDHAGDRFRRRYRLADPDRHARPGGAERSPTTGGATSARRWAWQEHGYPNLLTTAVPLAPSAALCNMTTCLQQQTEWISDVIAHVREQGAIDDRADEGDRGRLGRPPRRDLGRHADREHDRLVPRLERARQAPPRPVLHRRRGHLPQKCDEVAATATPASSSSEQIGVRRWVLASTAAPSTRCCRRRSAPVPCRTSRRSPPTATAMIYEGGAGVRIAGESDDPVTTATQFRIMSMTKMVCTTAALQQVERGELDLDAPVDTYLPAFADLQVLDGFDDNDTPRLRAPASRATVRNLVTHTSGLGYWFFDADLMRYEQVTGLPNVVPGNAEAFKAPLVADPGDDLHLRDQHRLAGPGGRGGVRDDAGRGRQGQDHRAAGHGRHDVPPGRAALRQLRHVARPRRGRELGLRG